MVDDDTDRRAPGRPRSSVADAAILEAAVDLFAEVGLEGLTMEGVAARAGVGKGTIYRRYENKIELVTSAIRGFTNVGEPSPDTGSTRGDVRALVDGLVTILTETPVGRLIPILSAARGRIPELAQASAEISAERRAGAAEVVRRGIARGDFRPDVDVDLVIDSVIGGVFYRFLVTGAPLDDRFRAQVVEAMLRAFGA